MARTSPEEITRPTSRGEWYCAACVSLVETGATWRHAHACHRLMMSLVARTGGALETTHEVNSWPCCPHSM